MMKIIILVAIFLSNLLIAKDIKYLNCLYVDKKEICITEEDSIEKGYRNILINDIYISQYAIKNNKKSIHKPYQNIFISENWLSIYINNEFYFYNFDTKKFIQISNFNVENFIFAEFLNNDHFAIQYYSSFSSSLGIKVIDLTKMHILHIDNYFYDDILKRAYSNHIYVIEQILKKEGYPKINYNNGDFFHFNENILSSTYNNQIEFFSIKKIENMLINHEMDNNMLYVLNNDFNVISSSKLDIDDLLPNYYKDIKDNFVHEKNNKSIFIILISIMGLIIIYFIGKKILGSYKLPFLSSFIMLCYILFIFVGAVILNVFYFEQQFFEGFYDRKDLLYNIWKYCFVGLFLIPLGFLLSNKIFNFDVKILDNFFTSDFNNKELSHKVFILLVGIFMLSLFVLYIYIDKLVTLPLFGLFQNLSVEELSVLRSDAGNNFNGKVYRYMIFIKLLPLLCLMIAFNQYHFSNKWKILFLFLLLFNIFVNTMDLSKAPIVFLFLNLILLYIFLKQNLRWKYIILFMFLSFVILMIFYIVTFKLYDIDKIINNLASPFHRAFIGDISPLFFWQLYSEQYGLLFGQTFPNPKNIFPIEHIPITKEIHSFVYPQFNKFGIHGSMPTVFFADWFINFGWNFAIISMILFGFLIRTIDILFLKLIIITNDVMVLIIYVYMILFLKTYITSNFLGLIIDPNFIIPIIISLIIYLFIDKKKNLYKRK